MGTGVVERTLTTPKQATGLETGTHGRFLDFGRGTSVILHGRERVMTEAEGRAANRPLHIHVMLEGREIARALVPHLPEAVEALA